MKVISVDVARATWLFPTVELNPTGRSLTKAFLGLAERYNFKTFPKHTLDADPEAKGLVFNQGEFKNKEGQNVLVKLTVFADGVVSDSWSSTRDSEDLLRDAMLWMKTEHGFSIPAERAMKTFYLSQLTVAADTNSSLINPKFKALADFIAAKTTETGRPNVGFTFAGFSMWAKDWDKPHAPAPYRFEIKAGSSPEENRYFASAALPTDIHLAVLEEQERLLG